MRDLGDAVQARVLRELFLAAFGGHAGALESWVTDRLVSLLEEMHVRAGETIFSAGETPESFYFMREGGVRLLREGRCTWSLSGRQVFGILDGFLDRSRTRTAVATADLHLMKVRTDAWLELLDDSFELARASVLELARHVSQLEDRADASQLHHARVVAENPRAGPLRVSGKGCLTLIDRLALLRGLPILRGADVQPVADLALASRETTLSEAELLFAGGAPRDRIFVVVDGEIEAWRRSPDRVRTIGAGEIVCGATAFGDSALAWSARATRNGRTLSFALDDWFDLMEEHFDMVRSALAALSLQRESLLDELGAADERGTADSAAG